MNSHVLKSVLTFFSVVLGINTGKNYVISNHCPYESKKDKRAALFYCCLFEYVK